MTRMRLWAALVGVSLLAAGCSSGGGSSEDPTEGAFVNGEKVVSFSGAGGLKLAGTLGVPPGVNGPAPGVVIVASLAATADRNGFQSATDPDLLYQDISKALNAAGMVTLRYDRRGLGQSKLEAGSKLATYDQLLGDAQGAVKYLAGRREVGSAGVTVLGHDVGGWLALHAAASEPKVKGVTLLSTPGRPLVDVLADGFKAVYGAASADKFRATVASLVSTGHLPPVDAIAPQHQGVLGQGQDEILRGMFSASPLADAAKVKVPAQVVYGTQSTTVTQVDADNLARAIGGSTQVVSYDGGTNLKVVLPDGEAVKFDPNDESTHVFGARPILTVPRDTAALGKIATFLLAAARGAKA